MGGKWAEKKIIDKREKAAYNENNKGISKPMTEKSNCSFLFSESHRWWNCGGKACNEWTWEGGPKRFSGVVANGSSTRYPVSIHVSVWNKWALGQFGWYRRSLRSCPYEE